MSVLCSAPMNLCTSFVSCRPYPTVLRKHFADPRGRALSCFAVAERQTLIAVCTENYGSESQALLERAYGCRQDVYGKGDRSVARDTSALNCAASSAARGKGLAASTEPATALAVGAFLLRTCEECSLLRACGRDDGSPVPSACGGRLPAKRGPDCPGGVHGSSCTSCWTSPQSLESSRPTDVSPACSESNHLLSTSRTDARAVRVGLLDPRQPSPVYERQSVQDECGSNCSTANVYGRCVILLDSRSLLPLRELFIGDMPAARAGPPLCVCCCGHCASGDCRLCSSASSNEVKEPSEETSCCGGQGIIPPERGGTFSSVEGDTRADRAQVAVQENSRLTGDRLSTEEKTDAREHNRLRTAPDAVSDCGYDAEMTELCLVSETQVDTDSVKCEQIAKGARKICDKRERRRRSQLSGKRSVTGFFKCESLFFACEDRLLCLVSAVMGVKILQLAELPDAQGDSSAFPSSCRPPHAGFDPPSSLCTSFSCGGPPRLVESSAFSSMLHGLPPCPKKDGQPYEIHSGLRDRLEPSNYTLYRIEDRFPRLLAHLQFLPNLLTPPCHLEVFQLLDAGFVATEDRYQALLRRLWTQDEWRGPSCWRPEHTSDPFTVSGSDPRQTIAGSREKASNTAVFSRSRADPMFPGPFVLVDCLVRFESSLPVRLLIDITHGNKVIHSVSLLPEDLVLSCCTRLFDPACREAAGTRPASLHADRLCSEDGTVARPEGPHSFCSPCASGSLDPSRYTTPPISRKCHPATESFAACASGLGVSLSKPLGTSPSEQMRGPFETRSDVRHGGSTGFHTGTGRVLKQGYKEEKAASSEGRGSSLSTAENTELSGQHQQVRGGQAKRTKVQSVRPSCRSTGARVGRSFSPRSASSSRPCCWRRGLAGGVGVSPEDLDVGNWRVRDAVTFPLAAFRAKEDFSFHFTSGFQVSRPTPFPRKDTWIKTPAAAEPASGVARCSGTAALPAFAGHPSRSGWPFPRCSAPCPPTYWAQGREMREIRGGRKRTDDGFPRRLLPRKTLNQLEADFPVNSFYQLLHNSNAGKSGRADNSIPLFPIPPLSRSGVPGTRGSVILRSFSSDTPLRLQANRRAKSCIPFHAGILKNGTDKRFLEERRDSGSERLKREQLPEKRDSSIRRDGGEAQGGWLIAVALPNALIVVVDLHHRVLAR